MGVKLGSAVKDVITGQRGVAISRVEAIDGRIYIEVQPPVKPDNEVPSSRLVLESNCASVKGTTAAALEPALPLMAEEAAGADAPAETASNDDDDFTSAPPATAPAANGFDADDDFTTPAAAAPQKTATTKAPKAKKLTVDDVNDACKAKAKALGGNKAARDKVMAALQKNFGTQSVSELKQDQFAKCIELMAVA